MSSLWQWFAFILLTLFPNADAQNNFCTNYTNISDPWRNVGFCSSSCNKSDVNLTTGWYRFSGVGGDQVVTSCGRSFNTTSQNVNVYNLFTCNSTVNYTDYLTCSEGVTIYYLHPSEHIYATRHSLCTNSSSCGKNAECGTVFGSCTCHPGLIANLSKSSSYGCSVLTVPSGCQTTDCAHDFVNNLNQLLNNLDKPLPPKTVEVYLSSIMSITTTIDVKNSTDTKALVKYANNVLAASEKLVSFLVAPTETENSTRIQNSQMEAEVFTVGIKTTLNKMPPLNSSNCSLNIDLIEISKTNNGSASVVFISYSNMANILKASLFNTNTSTVKSIISPVVSTTLPESPTTNLSTPVNFTFRHEFTLSENRSCVYWNETEWITTGCTATEFNSTYTVCSCVHLSTFALIMETDPDKFNESDEDPIITLINNVAVSVGLFFLFLTILTLAFCQRGTKVTNAALLNLSLSLFLAHIIFLLTQEHLQDVKVNYTLCMFLAGIIHFLFLSAFVWMLIEAILLYIFVKNLSRISSMQSEALNWKYMIVIGYIIPLSVVGVTSGLCPGSYNDKLCWLSTEFIWTFLGPVTCIIAINLLLSCVILINLKKSLANLNKTVTHLKHTRTLVLKTLMQFVILGCPWVLGLFFKNNTMLHILFIFFNSQQGTFIFIVHCVLNEEIRQQYKKWWNAFWHHSNYKSMPEDQTSVSHSHSNLCIKKK